MTTGGAALSYEGHSRLLITVEVWKMCTESGYTFHIFDSAFFTDLGLGGVGFENTGRGQHGKTCYAIQQMPSFHEYRYV